MVYITNNLELKCYFTLIYFKQCNIYFSTMLLDIYYDTIIIKVNVYLQLILMLLYIHHCFSVLVHVINILVYLNCFKLIS